MERLNKLLKENSVIMTKQSNGRSAGHDWIKYRFEKDGMHNDLNLPTDVICDWSDEKLENRLIHELEFCLKILFE